jgi:RND family efflux transporter MFP subunit
MNPLTNTTKNLSASTRSLLTALSIFLLAGCTSSQEETPNAKTAAIPGSSTGATNGTGSETIALATFSLQKGRISSNLQIPAELVAYRQVDLYAKVNSFVKDLKVDIGSRVKPGQLLVTLDAPELKAQLAAAESRMKSQEAIYTSSSATYNRILKTSNTPGTIAKNDLEIALAKKQADEAQWEAAKASYKEAATILDYLTITAPFAGVISSRNVNQGAYVGPSGKGSELPIFTLQELKRLRLVVSIPEAYKAYIRLGDEVKFTVKAYPNKIFTGRIQRRADAMDTQLRSERIELDVINEDNQLSPGMVAEAILSLSGADSTFLVPRSAVVNSAEGVFLVKVTDNKTQRVNIKKGRETDSLTEVYGNLQAGETFAKKGSEEIR